MKELINSLNSGEVTPLVHGRVDLENLRRACREMTNYVPRVFGGAFRRPSMMHVASANVPARHSRLIPFAFSSEKKFMIELAHLTMRVFNADTEALVFGPVASPWTDEQVDAVHLVQVNDVAWLVHGDVVEHELIRASDSSWTLTPIPWGAQNAFPPMRDENVSAVKLSAASTTGAGVILSSTADLFAPGHVGSYWQIGHFREILSSELTFDPDPRRSGETAGLVLAGHSWSTVTTGRWSGTLIVEKFNTSDLAWDIEEQKDNTTGNQVATSGTGSGTFRIRVRDVTVSPGSDVTFTLNASSGGTATLTFAPPSYLTGTGNTLRVNGRWDISTYGRWAGNMYLEEQNAAGEWDILRSWSGEMDRNISTTGTSEGETVLRLRGANVYAAPASDVARPRWVLEATDALVSGLVKVVSFVSPRQVLIDVVKPLHSTAQTTSWSEGAFSTYRGFPRTVALHEQRLIFAGTASQQQNIWGSVIADFRNFRRTGLDDGSFSYQVAAQESNPIVWMASQDGLIVGTEGDEWLIDGSGDNAITPSSVFTKRQSGEGSAPLQAQLAGSVVLFVERGGFHLREYVFQWESQNFVAPYVTQLFAHQTLSGVRAFAVARTPDRTIWVVTNDGKLLSCAYRREERVVAWARHATAGTVESVACVYGLPAGGDEIWLVVNREGTRRIERFKPGHWADVERGLPVWHLDAAKEKTGEFSVLDGIGHLEGLEVGIVADGAEMPNARVVAGAVAVPLGTAHAVAGLNFTSRLQPMTFEVPLQDGTAQGRRFRVSGLTLLLYKTQAGTYSVGPGRAAYPLIIRSAGDDAGAPPPAFSGMKRLEMMGEYRDGVDVVIETSSAMPLNVLSLIPTLQVYGS